MEVKTKLTEKAQRDYQLIRRALDNNDQRAYSELMRNYSDSLYFLMLKMTKDPNDAKEITIESFGKAFKSLSSYEPEYGFSTWLFKIATNSCIDFLRRKNNTLVDSVAIDNENSDNLFTLPNLNPDPEELYIKKQKKEALTRIISKLKPNYQTLINLRYFKEFSYEEIALELKLPKGTVKAQLFRARGLLYKLLKDKKSNI